MLNATAVVLDNFYQDPDRIREHALGLSFYENTSDHKGKRTKENGRTSELKYLFERLLGIRISNWDTYGYNGVFQLCVAGDPPVFHSDLQRWAGTIYLTPNAPLAGGTGLFRSKSTGLRSVEEAKPVSVRLNPGVSQDATLRFEDRNKTVHFSKEDLAAEMYEGKLLDSTQWEQVDFFGNVYNRLVLWDARLVHAVGAYFGHDLHTGRLSQLFFFDGE